MSENELIRWFWNKYNSCYPVLYNDYPESIFMYYDEKFIRKVKLNKISGQKTKMPSVGNGVCLFEQDLRDKYFFYDYEIYSFLKDNCIDKNQDINKFIQDRLNETKLSVLKSNFINYDLNMILDKPYDLNMILDEPHKLSVITIMAHTKLEDLISRGTYDLASSRVDMRYLLPF